MKARVQNTADLRLSELVLGNDLKLITFVYCSVTEGGWFSAVVVYMGSYIRLGKP